MGRLGECCRDCTERFEACHDVCTTYLKAHAEWEEHKAMIREAKKNSKLWDDYYFKMMEKTKKVRDGKKKR